MNDRDIAKMFKCGSCGAPSEMGCPCMERRRVELRAYMLGVPVSEWMSDPDGHENAYRREWKARGL